MKKRLFIAFLGFIVIAFLLAACGDNASNATNDDKSSLNALKEEYPDLKKSLKAIPENAVNKIRVPDMNTIPFEIENIDTLDVDKTQDGDNPLFVDVRYHGENELLQVRTYTSSDFKTSGGDANYEEIELDNGLQAKQYEGEHATGIKWKDKSDGVAFDVKILTPSDNEYTKDDMLKIANSID